MELSRELSREQKLAFNAHVREAQAQLAGGDTAGALRGYEEALATVGSHAQLEGKIAKLRLKLTGSAKQAAPPPPPPRSSDSDDDGPVVPARRLGQPAVAAAPRAVRAAHGCDEDDDDDGPVVPARRPPPTDSVRAIPAPPPASKPAEEDDEDDDVVVCTRRAPPPSAAPAASLRATVAAPAAAPLRPPKPPRVVCDGYSVDPSASPTDSEALATLPGGFGLPMRIFSALYPYQRAGVAWMWSLHPDSPPPLPRPAAAAGGGEGEEAEAEAPTNAVGGKITGAILADDMGLGKTAQTIAYVAGLFHSERAELVLVVAPLSVLPVWEAELARWAPEVVRYTFHGQTSESARRKLLCAARQSGGVVLTTYGLVTSAAHVLGADPSELGGGEAAEGGDGEGEGEGEEEDTAHGGDDDDDDDDAGFKRKPKKAAAAAAAAKPKKAPARAPRKPAAPKQRLDITWDLVVTDEGHKLKNASTLVAKAARALPSRARLLLSGTPMPNNLDELWSLYDYVGQGALLGSRRTFNRLIGDRIVAARDRHATVAEKRDGHLATQQLQRTIAPYLLRREKADVFAVTAGGSNAAAGAPAGAAAGTDDVDALAARLGGVALGGGGGGGSSNAAAAGGDGRVRVAMGVKKELVLWTRPSALQLALYAQHLGSADVDAAVRRTGSPLAAITVMRQISAHPLLLKPAHALWASVAAGQPALAATLLAPAGLPLGGSGGNGAPQQDADEADDAPNQLDVTTQVVEDDGDEDGGDADATRGAAAAGVRAPPPQQLPLPPASVLVAMSGKLATLVALLRLLVARQHKVLLFSQSKRMLDLLSVVLRALHCPSLDGALCEAAAAAGSSGSTGAGAGSSSSSSRVDPRCDGDEEEGEEAENEAEEDDAGAAAAATPSPRGVRFVRIDGDVPLQERRAIVEAFNAGEAGAGAGRRGADAAGPRVCLLTTGVGALGLTLTSADRVIMFDPSWNPSVDSQSVDRAYRLGQTRDVVTYRLITCGTVEERQYGRQLFKGGLTSAVLTGGGGGGSSASTAAAAGGSRSGGGGGGGWVAPSRIMSRSELKELFTLGATASSDTAARLATLSAPPPVRSPAIAAHLAELTVGVVPAAAVAGTASPEPTGPRRHARPPPPPPISALVASLSHHDHLLDLRVSDRDAQEAGAPAGAATDAAGRLRRGASASSSGSGGGSGSGSAAGAAATPAAPRTLRKAAAAAGAGGAPSSPRTPPPPAAEMVVDLTEGGQGTGRSAVAVPVVVDLTGATPARRAVVIIEDTPSAAVAGGGGDMEAHAADAEALSPGGGGVYVGAGLAFAGVSGAGAVSAAGAAPTALHAAAGGSPPGEWAPANDVDATRMVGGDDEEEKEEEEEEEEPAGDACDSSDGGATRLARGGADEDTHNGGSSGGDDGDVDGVMGQLSLSPVFAPSGRPSRRSLLAFAPPPLQLHGGGGGGDGGGAGGDMAPLSPIIGNDVGSGGGDGDGWPRVAPRAKRGLSLGREEADALRRMALAEAAEEEKDDDDDDDEDGDGDHDDGGEGEGVAPDSDGAAGAAAHQALLDEALAFIEAHEGGGGPSAPPGTMAAMQLQAMQAAAALGLM